MKASVIEKLKNLRERQVEVGELLSQPDTISDQDKFRQLSKEFAQLEPIVVCFGRYEKAVEAFEHAKVLMKDEDPDLREMAEEEFHQSKADIDSIESELKILLLPRDPDDDRNIYLEVRAGTGGDEAALFAGDLARMYMRYAEIQGWTSKIASESLGDHGGYKEVIIRISGQDVYANLKFESGAHRVQRVPETESQGRVHTSACTVAVMAEADEVDEVDINPADLKVDTYRSSGAGGQHVNTTDSAVRITHLPTGVVVECQDERSQHKNRAKAMALLQTRILAAEKAKHQAEQAQTRRNLVGSGDRSERIRTYNFPQGRMTDHRINLTLYKLSAILEGELQQVIEPLIQEHQADLLSAVGD